jgi:hypothetical protein
MSLRSATIAAFLISATAALPASAATYLTFNGTTGVFGNDRVAGGSFDDAITIPGLAPGAYWITATISSSYQTDAKALQDIDFTNVTLNGSAFDTISSGRFEIRTATDVLSTLNNQIHIAGSSGDNASYSGTINVSRMAAVPEPASWALMVGGFGLIGGALRRRRPQYAYT